MAYGFIRNRPKVASINLFSLSLSPFSCIAVPVINGHHHHEHSTIGFFFLLFHIIHKSTNSNVHKYKGDSSSSTSSWNFSIPWRTWIEVKSNIGLFLNFHRQRCSFFIVFFLIILIIPTITMAIKNNNKVWLWDDGEHCWLLVHLASLPGGWSSNIILSPMWSTDYIVFIDKYLTSLPIPHQEWLCAHHDSSRHRQQCRRFRKVAKIINQKASFFYFCRSSDQSADQLLKIVLMISQLQEASQQNKHPEKMYTLNFLVE